MKQAVSTIEEIRGCARQHHEKRAPLLRPMKPTSTPWCAC